MTISYLLSGSNKLRSLAQWALVACGIFFHQHVVQAQELAEKLFLEVVINKNSTKLIAAFFRDEAGNIGATIDELSQLGIKIPISYTDRDPQTLLRLNQISTLNYVYDEAKQVLNIDIENHQRLAKQYFPRDKVSPIELSQSGLGAVLNYSMFASSNNVFNDQRSIGQLSTNLEGWIYSPVGNFYSSAIFSSGSFTNFEDANALRLETKWSYDNPKNMTVTNIGDVISGGLAWTRPIRMGGVQIQKNFALRPDLITTPLLNATGSAAVPSTVDIYLGNFKAHSQKVDAGRFSINQVPSVSGAGDARIVVTDATGREQVSTKPFYISSQLLRPGLFDYSAEIGLARLNYGANSNDYAQELFASTTFRYGLNDTTTLEGHTEFGGGIFNAGLGTSFTFANRALLSLAGVTSIRTDANEIGYQLFGSFDTKFLGMNLHASTKRTFGGYLDLASISEDFAANTGRFNAPITSRATQKALDQISIGIPLPKLKAGLNLSFTHLEDVVARASNTLAVSYSQKIFDNASLSLSAYSSSDFRTDMGMYLNVSFPLSERMFASTGIDQRAGEIGLETTISKFGNHEPGSVGWSLSQTNGNYPQRRASVNYLGNFSSSQIELYQNESDFSANAYVSGSIVGTSSGLFFSRRIDDAFAIVETGAPGIPVYLSNQQVGITNPYGNLLVPGLGSYEENELRIDPENLPINASITHTQQTIVPPKNSGVKVSFGVKTVTQNAVVIFKDSNDNFLPIGSIVQLIGAKTGSNETFIIGYDGRAYLESLAAHNTVLINTPNGKCKAQFNYVGLKDQQVEIGPVICTN